MITRFSCGRAAVADMVRLDLPADDEILCGVRDRQVRLECEYRSRVLEAADRKGLRGRF